MLQKAQAPHVFRSLVHGGRGVPRRWGLEFVYGISTTSRSTSCVTRDQVCVRGLITLQGKRVHLNVPTTVRFGRALRAHRSYMLGDVA